MSTEPEDIGKGRVPARRKKGVTRAPKARRAAPATALDAYLFRKELTNAAFARQVQALREHRTSPSVSMVCEWRLGRKNPNHDFRIYIELASAGEVSRRSWPSADNSGKGVGRGYLAHGAESTRVSSGA